MKKLLPIAIAFFTFILLVTYVEAQTASTLTVAPSRQEIPIDPGETAAFNIKFYNRGDTPISGLLKVADFIVEDKEGTPIFIEEETPIVTGVTQISPRFSAASWVTLPYDRITIAAKDKVTIQVKISAPADARPGGRYVAVYFEPSGTLPGAIGAPTEAVSPVAVRIAGLAYLRVSGPITEDAYLVQFAAPRFSEYGPVSITSEILNRGDYHIRPLGTITLTNMLGKPVAQEKLVEENIFPDASRIFENELGQKWMFGKYKAELTASYGETGKVLTGVTFFWVFPWKVITAVVLAVIIVILLVTITIRRFKRRQEELETRLAEEEKKIEELKEKLEKKSE